MAVVHNGVIENHTALRKELTAEGFVFQSQTETEATPDRLPASWNERASRSRPCERVAPAGGYLRPGGDLPGLRARPSAARLGSPLVVGVGDDEHLLASDAVAIAPYTARVAYLKMGRSSASPRPISRSATCERGRPRRGSTRSTGSRTRSSWADMPITCSRRSASSPRPSSTPAGGGSAGPKPLPDSAG